MKNQIILRFPYVVDCVELFVYVENQMIPLHAFVSLLNNNAIVFGQDNRTKKIIPYYYSNEGLILGYKPNEHGDSIKALTDR